MSYLTDNGKLCDQGKVTEFVNQIRKSIYQQIEPEYTGKEPAEKLQDFVLDALVILSLYMDKIELYVSCYQNLELIGNVKGKEKELEDKIIHKFKDEFIIDTELILENERIIILSTLSDDTNIEELIKTLRNIKRGFSSSGKTSDVHQVLAIDSLISIISNISGSVYL